MSYTLKASRIGHPNMPQSFGYFPFGSVTSKINDNVYDPYGTVASQGDKIIMSIDTRPM